MENLIIVLKSKLILHRKNELDKAKEYKSELDKDLLLISTGKILELDNLINCLSNMLDYHQSTKEKIK